MTAFGQGVIQVAGKAGGAVGGVARKIAGRAYFVPVDADHNHHDEPAGDAMPTDGKPDAA